MYTDEQSFREQSRRFFRSDWAPVLIGGTLIALLIFGRLVLDRRFSDAGKQIPAGPSREVFEHAVGEILVAHEVSWEPVHKRQDSRTRWQVRIPADLPESDLYVSLQKGLFEIEAGVLRSHSDPATKNLVWELGWGDSCLMILDFVQSTVKRSSGRIAILIDDFGDRDDAFARSFLNLGPVSISVIPGLPKSEQIAARAMERGIEVLLHLPMEPLEGRYPDPDYTIITEMSREQVEDVFHRALKALPGVRGVNNHMGSRVTGDRRIMGYLMAAIKPENLYFLDSRTIASSVAHEMAMTAGLRCAERDVFLDTDQETESIRLMMAKLADTAEQNGKAIGIGHCYRSTLEVLRAEIPRYQEKGFRFVRLSELMD
ncbi:divergent polysaccharide deacetylase family protein [bacterium]|nr:divergent polysaccharide deacetylase family protein [bacterium]